MSGQTLVRADVPLPGGAEAVYGPGGAIMYYRRADLLGSSRLATTQAGSLYSTTAYAPFGEAMAESGAQDRSFTGKEQDIASGQAGTDPHGSYDFPAREYSPTQSRWWSPDPRWGRWTLGIRRAGTATPTPSIARLNTWTLTGAMPSWWTLLAWRTASDTKA